MDPEPIIRAWLEQEAQMIGPTYTMGILPDGRSVLYVNEGGVTEPAGSDDVRIDWADDALWCNLRGLAGDPGDLEGNR